MQSPAEMRKLLLRLFLVVVAFGCAGDVIAPPDLAPSAVLLLPSPATLLLSDSLQLTARVTDLSGNLLPDAPVVWESSNPAVVTVSTTGVIAGVRPGVSFVTATSGEVQGRDSVTILPLPPPVPASLTLTPGGATLEIGDTLQLVAEVRDGSGDLIADAPVGWTTTDPSHATVSPAGTITAHAAGGAIIVATSGAVADSAPVTVSDPPPPVPDSVAVAPDTATIRPGDHLQLSATVFDSTGATIPGAIISWVSTDSLLAAVSTTGEVTGLAPGVVTVTATSGTAAGSATVTIILPPPPVPDSVAVMPTAASIQIGSNVQLVAQVFDSTGALIPGAAVTWSSSNVAKATVSTTGEVNGVTAGTVTITATSGVAQGTSAITITTLPPPVPDSVVVTPAAATVQAGDNVQLSAQVFDSTGSAIPGAAVIWASSDPSKATVGVTGTVHGLAVGTATITATSGSAQAASVITVTPAPPPSPDSVAVTPAVATILVGDNVQLSAQVFDSTGTPIPGAAVTWSSANPGKATVSATGKVSGIAAGTATITATSGSVQGTAIITVTIPQPPQPDSVAVTPAAVTLQAGDSVQLGAQVFDSTGTVISGATVTWGSSDPAVATVTGAGKVRSLAAGSVTITATSGPAAGTAVITVTSAPPPTPATITVTPNPISMVTGTTLQLVATARDANGNVLLGVPITWATTDVLTVTVSTSGRISGMAPGSATITATSGSIQGTTDVTVTPSTSGFHAVIRSFLGGSGEDMIRDIATDSQGNIYVCGSTESPDYPTTSGAYSQTLNTGSANISDAFVTKLSPNGTIIWSTFVGGPNFERCYAMEVDAQGFVYIAGRGGRNLPVTAGAFQTTFGGGPNDPAYGQQDGFVCKLQPDGSALVFCSYLGTSDNEIARDIAIDNQGDIYLAAGAEAGGFPSTWFANAFQPSIVSGLETLVVKVKADGSQVLWASYLGGSGDESGTPSLRVDAGHNVYVLLSTGSSNMPTPAAFDPTLGGTRDLYLAKLSATGSQLLFGTYLGGSGDEQSETHGITLDQQGNVIVAATTTSTNFPVTPGVFQDTKAGVLPGDVFVSRFSPFGSLIASTYVGGENFEAAEGVLADGQGNIWISGTTHSHDFPRTESAGTLNDDNYFLLRLSSDLKQMDYGGVFGGSDKDAGRGLIIDLLGRVWSGGQTSSSDWPTLAPIQGVYQGGLRDGALVSVSP